MNEFWKWGECGGDKPVADPTVKFQPYHSKTREDPLGLGPNRVRFDSPAETLARASYPKTREDPLGQGPKPTVATTLVRKLRNIDTAVVEAKNEYHQRLYELNRQRAALLDTAKHFSATTLTLTAEEVRKVLA